MKNLVLTTAVLALALVTVFPPSALAQSASQRYNVPFTFSVGDRTFAPGEYIVQWSVTPNYVQLMKIEGRSIFLPQGYSGKAKSDAIGRMVFNKYGTRYFLHGLERPGAPSRYEWSPSKAERDSERASERVQIILASR